MRIKAVNSFFSIQSPNLKKTATFASNPCAATRMFLTVINYLLLPLSQIFSTIDSLPASGLTPWTSRPDHFMLASPFFVFSFFIILFCLVPCGRLSWLLVSFWAHVNIVHRIVLKQTDKTNAGGWQMQIISKCHRGYNHPLIMRTLARHCLYC